MKPNSFWGIPALFSFLVLFIIPVFSFAAKLNGTYTIGGSSPNYTSFSAAVSALTSNGISGPVVFKVRKGSYNEQIYMGAITGSSVSSPITFQSETGNPADVVLWHMHGNWSTNANYTLYLDGANNLVFRNMTLQAIKDPSTNYDYNRVIYITNNASNLLFENNVIRSWNTSANYFSYNDCIYVGTDYNTSTGNDSITFLRNTIIGGSKGLNMQGSESALNFAASDWKIENNVFMDQGDYGLYVMITHNTRITGNRIYSTNPYSTNGIYVDQSLDSLLIDGNFVKLDQGGTGIFCSNVISGKIHVKEVTNNIVIISKAGYYGPGNGIQGENNDSILVAYNAVVLGTGDSTGYCISSTYGDTMLVYNNQLENLGGGLCYYQQKYNGNGIFASDYNNLFNNKKTVAKFDTITYDSVPMLYSGRGSDKHSLSVNPMFMNDTVLIPYNPKVFGAGTPLGTMKHDYFGSSRSATATTIGIFEGSVPALDAGLSASYLPPRVCPGDSIPFYVKLKNYGTSTLTSVDINYHYYGITKKLNWSGSLGNWKEADSIFLGYVGFSGTGNVSVKVWTSKPNGLSDAFALNDTINLLLFLSMKGNYSIGKSPADYSSITSAVEAIKTYGVCGPVTFNIDSGKYTEQVIIPAIPGASAANTVTFQSKKKDSSSVIIEYTTYSSVNSYVFNLTGAQYVNFRYLTLSSPWTSASGLVWTDATTSYVTLANNVFTEGGYGPSVILEGTYCNVLNNNFAKSNGLQLSISGSLTNPSGNRIEGNIFQGNASQCLMAYGIQDIYIGKNIFKGTRSKSPTALGLSNCGGGSIIIEKNKFDVTEYGQSLIGLDNCIGTKANPLLIANNFITTRTGYYSLGITLSTCSFVRIVNNSFNMVGPTNQAIQLDYKLSAIELYNNIYCTPIGGSAYTSFYKIDTSQLHSDYNVFYSSDAEYISNNGIESTLSDWIKATGLDAHSLVTNPLYFDSSNLHINNAAYIHNKGLHLPYITDDIDNEVRNKTAPDIGADEFRIDSTTYRDLAVWEIINPDSTSCTVKDSVIIVVQNLSAIKITSFDVQYDIYNVAYPVMHFTIPISPHSNIRLNLGYFPFAPNTNYDFHFAVSNPNMNIDNLPNNDSLSTQYYSLEGVKIFQRATQDCNGNTELYIKDFPRASMLWSTGSANDRITVTSPGTYSVTVTDIRGCKVTDSLTLK